MVLAFYPAAFSGNEAKGCTCQLNDLKPLAESGIRVLGISKDTPFTLAAWKEKLNLNYDVLSDHTLDVSQQYVGTIDLGAFLGRVNVSTDFGSYFTSQRGVVVVDEAGKVVYAWTAPTPGELPDVAAIKKALGK